MKRFIICILSAFAVMLSASAQSSIKVQVPNVVAVDEQFNVSFIIEGENQPTDFSWNPGSDFQLVWGPQKGTSTSLTIIGGKRTKSTQSTYTYVLMPKKTGTFTIASASAKVKNNTIESGPVTVEVVSGSTSSSGSSSAGASSQPSESASTGDINRDDLFLRFTLSRTNVVVGEPVTATLKLYQRVNIAGFEDVKFPTFNGFWSQEVLAPSNIEFSRESYNNMIYNAAILRSYVLIPQQSGDLVIDPAELVCLVNVRSASSHSNSIFDSFFQDDYRTIRKRVTSDACKVHVSSLPSGAPSSFGGGVGTFNMDVHLSKDSLMTHDAASLVVTVSGKGNVSLLEAPKIDFPPDFEVYDVKVSDNVNNGATSGSKTFEYPFIPRSHGNFEIGPVEYSYYDIDTRRYVTLKGNDIHVRVAKGKEQDAGSGMVVPGTVRKDVRSLASDIRFISGKYPSLSDKGSFFVFSGLFWILLFVVFASASALYFFCSFAIKRQADVVGSRNRSATKMARKRLSLAGNYLAGNLYTAFYEELHRALLGFIADKLNIDSADMSRDNIAQSLSANGVNDSLANGFNELLEACEYARYAPDAGHDAMNTHYNTALDLITAIDASMKKRYNASKSAAKLMLLLLLCGGANAWAADGDALRSQWDAAVNAYSEGRWDAALDNWLSIEASGVESSELYYNLGNVYFKMDDLGHSILYYERALKLDPSLYDASFNLEYISGFCQDKIESVPQFFIETWIRNINHIMSSDSWSILFLIFLFVGLSAVVLFILSAQVKFKKIGFGIALASLIVSIVCICFAASQKTAYLRQDNAIIMIPVSSVKSSPGSDTAKDLFILHEGTRLRVLDNVGSWYNIELLDGRQGWIISSDIELY